jgi:uncharacterized protein (DUF1501 family)
MTTNISRRSFLQTSAATAAFALFSRFNVSFAAAPGEERFIFVILRGAMDGLAAVPSYGDRNYKTRAWWHGAFLFGLCAP